MRVYLDIWTIQRPLDDRAQLRVRLEAEAVVALIGLCEAGRIELVVSAAHEIENDQNPYPERQAHTSDVLALSRHRVVSGAKVAARTASYEQSGLKRLDAYHLAAAVTAEADYFCTTDDWLLKRANTLDARETLVVSPIDLVLRLDLP